ILDSVPDTIVILNEDAQVQYINGASNKAFNLHESDLRGPTLFHLLKADDVTREQLETEMSHYVGSPQETAVVPPEHPAELSLPRDPLVPAIIRDPHPRKEIKFGHRTYHYTCFPVAGHSDEGQLMGLVLRDTTEESSLQNQ